ncbi:MAG: hypothetical protein KGV50_00360 [Gammaproteobacteria bacterium]|nr:hypothetical protein [Gammaproteobacteria bacterium]
MSTNTIQKTELLDIQENIAQLSKAMLSLTELMASCDDGNAPPISYLWRLVAILTQYCDSIEHDVITVLQSQQAAQ